MTAAAGGETLAHPEHFISLARFTGLLGPELDANYQRTKANPCPWPAGSGGMAT